jgi:hypothetical protein
MLASILRTKVVPRQAVARLVTRRPMSGTSHGHGHGHAEAAHAEVAHSAEMHAYEHTTASLFGGSAAHGAHGAHGAHAAAPKVMNAVQAVCQLAYIILCNVCERLWL